MKHNDCFYAAMKRAINLMFAQMPSTPTMDDYVAILKSATVNAISGRPVARRRKT